MLALARFRCKALRRSTLPIPLVAALLAACGGQSEYGAPVTPAPDGVTRPELPAVADVAADPAESGPLTLTSTDYDFGRITVTDEQTGDSYETDVHGYVTYPTDATGPFPVLLFQHGRHQTCETTVGQLPFPVGDDNCPDLAGVITPANSYRGYDYLVQSLASHGYAVISIDTNDINDNDGSPNAGDAGALARAELILTHLDAFREIHRNGGQGFDALMGRLDFDRVGLMGHSRGGEGVNKTVTVNAAQDEPHNLAAVFSLAPTDYNALDVTGVTWATLLPYCDGDVENLMGAFAYDAARLLSPDDTNPRFQIMAMGANHNYFNTVWTSDDWTIHGTSTDSHCGTDSATHQRDTPEAQRALGSFFMASFFRTFVGGETAHADYWTGLAAVPNTLCPGGEAAGCAGRYPLSIYASATDRLIIDSTPIDTALSQNALGGAVTLEGFASFEACTTTGRDGSGCGASDPTFTTADQLRLHWTAPAIYRSALGDLDASDFHVLSLRVGLSLDDPANDAGQDFAVVLTDTDGRSARLNASAYSTDLFAPPGDAFDSGGSEKLVLTDLRIPLTEFPALDFAHLDTLELRFDLTPAGTVQITDLQFQRVAP